MESRYSSQCLAVEKLNHETDHQRSRTGWQSVRRLFPNKRPQQMAFCSAVAQQRFCSAFCSSQRLHLEREAERESRSEAFRTGATPVLPPVREREAERDELPFGAINARL